MYFLQGACGGKAGIMLPRGCSKQSHPMRARRAHLVYAHCSLPMCCECWSRLQNRSACKIPAALANDNFQGYAHPFIVRNKVKGIEAFTACPFFSSQITYYVEGKSKSRYNLAGEEMGRAERERTLSFF